MMAGRLSLVLSLFTFICVFTLLYGVSAKQSLITLNEDNWGEMLKGEWMVEFYAPWCPACKALQPVWDEFASWSHDLGITVAKIDVTEAPGLSGRFMVTALPTIFHVREGKFRQYRGGRDKDSLISFVEDKKWEGIEAVSWWKSPDTIQMSLVSYIFKLSTVLRAAYNMMVEDYGLPIWGAYLVFALATFLTGSIIGLLLVCVIDCFYGMKTTRPSPMSSIDNDEGDEGDDLIDEGAESGADTQPETQSEGEDEESRKTGDESQEDGNDATEADASPAVRKRRARKAD